MSTDTTPAANVAAFQTGHVGLNVTDVDRSAAFYHAVFGFRVLDEGTDPARRYAFLGDGDRLVLTLWQQADGRFAPRQAGLHHLAFQVESIAQVREAARRVREAGGHLYYEDIVPHAEGAQSGGIYFDDPDGTRLEIYAPSGVGDANPAPAQDGPACGLF
jgi:catechol-2,3-dioxygenase